METTLIIIAAAVVISWLVVIALNIVRHGRRAAEDNERIYYNRYKYPKK